MRYDYPAQKKDSKCTIAEYGALDEKSVTVKNSEIDPKNTEDGLKWALGYIYGKATQVEVSIFDGILFDRIFDRILFLEQKKIIHSAGNFS